jgi:hypothetical protein
MAISKILFIADASREALTSIVGALRVIKKDQLSIRAILLSFLSAFPEKDFSPLGPNTLFLLMQEEKEIVELIKKHFARMNIPCSFDFITMPNWEKLVEETEKGDQDLIILQGKVLKIWSTSSQDFRLCAHTTNRPKCPVLVINH